MGKNKPHDQNDALTRFQSLVDDVDGIEIKGAKSKYCAVNGNMFCFIGSGGRLAIRLSQDQREKFLADHGDDCISIEHNTVMKDYVLVPDSIMENNRKLKPLFKTCCENAFSLKPKPTTKKKAKKKAKPATKKKAAVKQKTANKKPTKSLKPKSSVRKAAKKKK